MSLKRKPSCAATHAPCPPASERSPIAHRVVPGTGGRAHVDPVLPSSRATRSPGVTPAGDKNRQRSSGGAWRARLCREAGGTGCLLCRVFGGGWRGGVDTWLQEKRRNRLVLFLKSIAGGKETQWQNQASVPPRRQEDTPSLIKGCAGAGLGQERDPSPPWCLVGLQGTCRH